MKFQRNMSTCLFPVDLYGFVYLIDLDRFWKKQLCTGILDITTRDHPGQKK